MQPTELARSWQNFYVIIGSSAGALTGLQFVVITLLAQTRSTTSMHEVRAFGTPTVVHFCVALMISAIVTAPWPHASGLAISLAVCGVSGIAYGISVIRHARRQKGYHPDFLDWMWYAVFPLFSYATLATAAALLPWSSAPCMFAIAVVALALLLIGIHNSWDTVTYIAVKHGSRAPKE